jgi:dolichol-phosphate mannosyltransferase
MGMRLSAEPTMTQLTILIPVYNEGENLRTTIDKIESAVIHPHSILVVYDHDIDTTIPVISDLRRTLPHIAALKNRRGPGVLNALRSGFDAVSDGAVVVCMGDASDDMDGINEMLSLINAGYDVVCGSRYMKGGRQDGGPFFKSLLSRCAGQSLHFFTGIPTHDISNSFKMFRASVVRETQIESTGGFEIGMEITVKAFLRGRRITEVPTVWSDRTEGVSKFKLLRWLPCYLRWYYYLLFHLFLKKRIQ